MIKITASTANNIVLSKEGKQVTIATTNTEDNITKALVTITSPKTTQNQDIADGANTTKILDILNKAEHRITVDGHLVNNLGSGDTSNTAEGKRTNLIEIFFAGGVISMTYEGETFNVNSDKMSIRRTNREGLAGDDGVTEFVVKATFIRGENLTG